MPKPVPPGFAIGAAQPADALAAFAERGLLQPTFNWHDVYEGEHASRFMVAGVAQADVLRLFKDELDKSLATGGSLADFQKRVLPTLQAKGWWGDVEITDPKTGEIRTTRFNEARLQLIYDTNLRQSYAAGRWAAIERNKKRQPLVMYRTMRDERVRSSHAAWDGLVLPVDDAFWRTRYPPNGWRCRCRAFGLSQRDVDRYRADGVDIKTTPPPLNEIPHRDPRTGETAKTPFGVDPGFAYNPGQTALANNASLQRQALDRADAALASAQIAAQVRSENFARFVKAPLQKEALPVARLPAADASALGANTSTVMLSAATVAKQATRHPDVAAADYAWVQRAIDGGERIQDGERTAIYLLEIGGWVAVVKATYTGQAVYLTSFRRLSSNQARLDEEVIRLRKKATGQKGADGGAPQSA